MYVTNILMRKTLNAAANKLRDKIDAAANANDRYKLTLEYGKIVRILQQVRDNELSQEDKMRILQHYQQE